MPRPHPSRREAPSSRLRARRFVRRVHVVEVSAAVLAVVVLVAIFVPFPSGAAPVPPPAVESLT